MEEKKFRVATHRRPDDDEFLAIEIIDRVGQKEFPGVRENPLITVDAGLRMTTDQIRKWLDGGHILVGTGGRLVIFEEHGKGDGRSAATYAADYFKVADDPALKPILAYSLRADDKAQDHPWAAASIIKSLHATGVPLEKVRTIHRSWFDALYKMFDGMIVFSENRTTFRQMAIAWLIAEYGRPEQRTLVFGTFADAMGATGLTPEQSDEVREIERFVDRDVTHGGFSNFDLNGLVLAMQVTGATEIDILETVHTVLNAKLHVQREYLSAQKYFLEKASWVDDCPLLVAVVRSDNEQMHRAARRVVTDLSLLIQYRSSGHVQIFSDQKRDLRPILRRLRALEYRMAGNKDQLSFTALSSGGTHHAVPQWFGFEKYEKIIHIFNGTLKTRCTPKTRLTLNEVVECVRKSMAHMYRSRGENRK